MFLFKKYKGVCVERFFFLKKEKVQFFQFNFTKNFFIEDLKKKFVRKKIPSTTFKFKLDTFQKIAIRCIELEKNFLVAANTSSGKTLIAEYAIARSIKNKKKVIYTTPIKALSNQKFRDLSKIFTNVGLITGDISINPGGNCIVMTTEVLRCILGNKTEKMDDLEWVIIDEAHYLKDFQRGFVWEEIFILLPKSVKFICLSATIPNILEFSEWLTILRESNFVSILAKKRPVPLREYLYFTKSPGLKLFKVSKNIVWTVNQKCFQKIKPSSDLSNNSISKKIKKLVEKLYTINYGPVILFTFSKKKCHEFAKDLLPISFCDVKCKKVIEKFLRKIKNNLTEKETAYLSFENYFEFFKKGIGIHHAGLSHFLREITETLFHANLLFILFATETFSIGLNMPSRTVIFSSLVKYDGKNLRFLNRGEFIQMSGRAGRRGLDKEGIVISILNPEDNYHKTIKVLIGNSEPIGSVYNLTLNTFLDFIDPKKKKLKNIIGKSFFSFQKRINLVKTYSLYYIFKKRKKLLFIPNFRLVLGISFSLKLFEKARSIKLNYYKNANSNPISIKHLPSKNCMKNTEYRLFVNSVSCSTDLENNWTRERSTVLKNFPFLKKMQFFKILPNKSICFNYKKFTVFIGVNSLSMEIGKILLRYTTFPLNIFFYHFISRYQLEFLKFKKRFEFKISKTETGSIYSNISRFFNSFLKIGIIEKNFNLTKKGELCSKINYRENLILIELIYHGTLVNFPFKVIITLLVGLVFKDQYPEISLTHCLFSPYKKFQLIVFKLYSVFKGSSISLNLWQIFKKKKKTVLNFTWSWVNNLCLKKNSKIFLDKEVFKKYLNYVLNILETITKIYQSLGNIFFSSKFENFWFRLKQKLERF